MIHFTADMVHYFENLHNVMHVQLYTAYYLLEQFVKQD